MTWRWSWRLPWSTKGATERAKIRCWFSDSELSRTAASGGQRTVVAETKNYRQFTPVWDSWSATPVREGLHWDLRTLARSLTSVFRSPNPAPNGSGLDSEAKPNVKFWYDVWGRLRWTQPANGCRSETSKTHAQGRRIEALLQQRTRGDLVISRRVRVACSNPTQPNPTPPR